MELEAQSKDKGEVTKEIHDAENGKIFFTCGTGPKRRMIANFISWVPRFTLLETKILDL